MAVRDFTTGSEIKHIVAFGIPVMAGNILMQLYNYVDSLVVGHYIGKEALAAVGASSPIIFMLVSVVIGISMGSTILISQRYGSGDEQGVHDVASTLYLFLGAAAVVLTIVGISASGYLLELIDLPKEAMPYAREYLNIYLLSLISLFIFNSLSAILRGVGDSTTPLIFLGISSLLNIVIDLLFVVVFDMGIAGVAWASVLAQGLAVIFAVNYTNRHNKVAYVNLLRLKFNREIFVKQLQLGLPAALQQLALSIGILAIFSIITGFGTNVVAGYTAASRIETFIFVIPMAMSMALTNFIGQNYGAGKIERIDRAIKGVVRLGFIMSFTILILLSALSRPLITMFFSDEETIMIGCNYLLVLALSYPIFYTMYILMGAMRGMGNTLIPMIITLLSLWVVRVPVAEVLSKYMGELGIWISSPISWLVGLIAAIVAFTRLRAKVRREIINRKARESEQTEQPAPSTIEG